MKKRLYLDEHVPSALASHLHRLGFDVLTTAEATRASQRVPDEDQVAFTAREQRAILTFNQDDFILLDAEWKAAGREHAGIILSPKLEISPLCQRVEAHLKRHTAEQQHNLLLWC